MVGAHIEMLQPTAVLNGPRPQGAEPITLAREHDACDRQLGQPALQAHLRRGRGKIDRGLKELPG